MPRRWLLAVLVLLTTVVVAGSVALAGVPDRSPASLAGLAGARARCVGSAEPGTSTITLDVDGIPRRYRLTTPARPTGSRPPLLLAFHGYAGSGEGLARRSGLERVAREAGIVLALPDGAGRPSRWRLPGRLPGGDDVAFADRLVVDAVRRTCADPARIVAAGFSNGAAFTSHLACRRPQVLAAVVLVSGANLDVACPGALPLPAVLVHGAADDIVPSGGGRALAGRLPVAPLADAIAWWSERGRCRNPAPLVPDGVPRASDGCEAEVTLVYSRDGHRWPAVATRLAADLAVRAGG